MRNVLAGLLVGLILGQVVPASAHHKDSLKALKKRVNLLETRADITDDETDILDDRADAMDAFAACLAFVTPMTRYIGYMYQNDAGTQFLTTAWDATQGSDPVGAWVSVVDESCVGEGVKPVSPRPYRR